MRIIGRGGSKCAFLFDAHDAIDGRACAGRRGVGARTRVGDRLPQRIALERGAIAHVESDARNRRRAAGGAASMTTPTRSMSSSRTSTVLRAR